MPPQFTAEDLKQLAELLAPPIAERITLHQCRFSDAEAAEIKTLTCAAKRVRVTALAALVGALVIGAVSLIGVGVVAWIKDRLQ